MAVEIDSVDRGHLPELLNGVDQLFIPFASRAIAVSLTHLEGLVSPYPPQPDRGRSKHFNTYIRGIGSFPKSAFIADSNEPGGYRVKKRSKIVGAIRMTSQQMDKRYQQHVVATSRGVEGILLNTATYSGWVIGSKDKSEIPHQVAWHTTTGWPNKDDTLTAAIPFINAQCESAVDALMAKIAGG